MARRRRSRLRVVLGARSGMVFAHGRQRDLVTGTGDVPPVERSELLAGRITTLVDRLRLRRRR